METKPPPVEPPAPAEVRPKIYFLPNLLTAGNLFCGFVALTKIVEANLTPNNDGIIEWWPIEVALGFISRLHFRFVRRPRGEDGRRGESVRPRV